MAMITPGSINMLHDAHPSQQGGNKVKGAKIELISNQDMRLTRGADQKGCALLLYKNKTKHFVL